MISENSGRESQNTVILLSEPAAAPAPPPFPSGRKPRTWIAGLCLLIAVHLSLGAHCVWRFSVTHDEYWHLPAGLAAWNGRFDADHLNPPLSRAWSAIPLAVLRVPVGEPAAANDSTALGDHFLAANHDRYHDVYAYGRLMNLAWSVLAGVLIAVWGRELFGDAAGFVGAALWFLCPVVLSNAALVTPDLCAACLFVAASYAAWRFARSPSWARAGALGLVLGLAQLSKFTCVLLLPSVVILWFVVRARAGLKPAGALRAAGQWGLVFVVCLFVWNAGYLFQGTGSPLNSYQFASQSLTALGERARPIGGLPVPAPHDYITGFDRQRSIMEAVHPVFLDGVWNIGQGFRDYYLRACAYKWSHGVQAIVVTALVSCIFTRVGRRHWRACTVVLIPAALVVVTASGSHMQLGVRYILPAFPLIYLFAGHVGAWLAGPRWTWRAAWVAVCLAALPAGLRYHPHHLAYFNELSGGPQGGRFHLLDSNIDWGQDLRELRDYLHEHDIADVKLAYFGMVPPAQLGIRYALPPSAKQVWAAGGLRPGWYAVSVNFVQGRPHTIRDADDSVRSAGAEEFGYFQGLTPVTSIGWSIDVYKVGQPDDSSRIRDSDRDNR